MTWRLPERNHGCEASVARKRLNRGINAGYIWVMLELTRWQTPAIIYEVTELLQG